ncbi:MAG: hypothetical protein RLN81_16525 [Balneolaceae bacterium]
MSYPILFEFLFWSLIIHLLILIWWAVFMVLGGDWVYKLHSRWFPMEKDEFTKIHYKGMSFYKILIFVFILVPLLVLWKMGEF